MSHQTLDRGARRGATAARRSEAFSTTVFTGANIAVFLVLSAAVAVAGLLYSRGA